MNDTPSSESQPRIPGVKYVKETRYRQQTTTIDGVPSTRNVPYDVLVPVPPRDWDEVILRGVTGLAMAITGLAVVGTTASVGGELSELLHPVISYGVGVVFTATWLACLGVEWVLRTDPKRANRARIAGWVTLAVSMAAVFSYGHDHGQDIAGAVGACLDLLAKGLWALLIHVHAVPLSEGVQHWLRDQQQTAASRSLLSRKIARLNRNEAYRQAVGGREYQAAGAILVSEEPVQALPAPVVITEPVPVAPLVVPAQPPAPVGSTPVEPAPVAPVVPVPVPVPVAPVGPAPVGSTPVVPAPVAPAPVVPVPVPAVVGIAPSIAQTVRDVLAESRAKGEEIGDDDLVAKVRAVHGDRKNLTETVLRNRRAEERKRKAS